MALFQTLKQAATDFFTKPVISVTPKGKSLAETARNAATDFFGVIPKTKEPRFEIPIGAGLPKPVAPGPRLSPAEQVIKRQVAIGSAEEAARPVNLRNIGREAARDFFVTQPTLAAQGVRQGLSAAIAPKGQSPRIAQYPEAAEALAFATIGAIEPGGLISKVPSSIRRRVLKETLNDLKFPDIDTEAGYQIYKKFARQVKDGDALDAPALVKKFAEKRGVTEAEAGRTLFPGGYTTENVVDIRDHELLPVFQKRVAKEAEIGRAFQKIKQAQRFAKQEDRVPESQEQGYIPEVDVPIPRLELSTPELQTKFPSQTKSKIPQTSIAAPSQLPQPTPESPVSALDISYKPSIPQTPIPVKERGFIKTIRESPNVSKKTVKNIENLPDDVRYYDVYGDQPALNRARSLIRGDGRESVHSYVMSAQSLDKDVAVSGIELARLYASEGKAAAEADVLFHLAELGTKSGQGVQGLSVLDKMSPEGWLLTASKRIQEGKKAGGKGLSTRAGVQAAIEDVETARSLEKAAAERAIRLKERGAKAADVIQAEKAAINATGDVRKKTEFLGTLDKKATALAEKRGALSDELAAEIRRRAEEIEGMEYGYYKAKKVGELTELIERYVPKTRGQRINIGLQEVLNSFRTMMAGTGVDFSFALRQGIMPFYRNPKTWLRSFKSQFAAARSEAGYEALMDSVYKSKYFRDAVEAGVSFTDVNAKLLLREERYMSSLAERVPLLGRNIRANARAYTGMANKLRMETFASLLDAAKLSGKPITKEVVEGFATLVNASTGRGDYIKILKGAAPLMNAAFFSPRLIASRAHFLNPWNYYKAPAVVRKEYLKSVLAYTAGTSTVIGLASLLPDVEVGLDWRSANFAKLRVGNTRFDLSGGFQPWLRAIGQIATGKYVSSSTGKITTLGEGYKAVSRLDIVGRFAGSKLSPPVSLVVDILRQQNPDGSEVKISTELGERVTPMIMADLWDIYEENPSLVPIALTAGVFGIGVQSYAPPEQYQKMEEIRNSENPEAAWEKLKKENPKLAEKVDRAGRESTFTEFDWSLTGMGVEDGARAKYLFERLERLPDEAAKAAMYKDLREKRLISDQVNEQLKYLYNAQNSPQAK